MTILRVFEKRTEIDTRLEPAWRGPLPTYHILTTHKVGDGIARSATLGLNRYDKTYKIPATRVCPTCRTFRPNDNEWIRKAAYLAVCKKCFLRGYRPSNKRQLEKLLAKKGLAKHTVRNRPQERLAAAKYARLIKTCGNPPVCWSCLRAVPVAGENKPGRKWVVADYFKPTCRSCWNKGARYCTDEFSSVHLFLENYDF